MDTLNATPIKILAGFFAETDMDKLILKFIWEYKRARELKLS